MSISTRWFAILKNLFLLAIVTFGFSLSTTSQVRCGSDKVIMKASLTDPDYRRNIEKMDQDLRNYIAAHPNLGKTDPNNPTVALYFIPVVVHVIHTGGGIGTTYNPSVATINSTIAYMNAVYDGTWAGTTGVGDLQIKFVLATKDPSNVATNGIDRVDGTVLGAAYGTSGVMLNGAVGIPQLTVKNLTRWDPFKYYNVWLVNRIDGCDGQFCGCACDASFVAGFAYFPIPTNATATSRDLDGTLMLATQFAPGQGTLPHELGHAFNLYHPFEGNTTPGPNTCPINAVPATDGDQIADTDPITDPSQAPNAVPFACRTGNNPCTVTPYTDNTEKNYMNYTNCNNLFTAGQKTRMHSSLNTTMRASQATSWANNQGTYPLPFVSAIAPVVTPSATTPFNSAGINRIVLNGRQIFSLSAQQDGGSGYVNRADKWYDLFNLTSGSTYNMTVYLMNGANNDQLGVWLDYNNNGIFGDNINEQLYLNTNLAAGTGAAGITFNFTIPGGATANTVLRMRLMDELSTIYGRLPLTGATAALVNGQAEDYPVSITSAVPVTTLGLSGFEKDNYATLQWKTVSEFNNKGFDLEKSFDGVHFTRITFVTGHGTSSASNDYRYNEKAKLADIQYYRLKQIDYDGNVVYSNTVSIKGRNNKFDIVSVTNPFNDKISMIFSKDPGSVVGVDLIDVAGRKVFSDKVSASGNTLSLAIPKLSSGAYLLKVMVNQEMFTRKVVKD